MCTAAAGLSALDDPAETRDKSAAAQILSSWTREALDPDEEGKGVCECAFLRK